MPSPRCCKGLRLEPGRPHGAHAPPSAKFLAKLKRGECGCRRLIFSLRPSKNPKGSEVWIRPVLQPSNSGQARSVVVSTWPECWQLCNLPTQKVLARSNCRAWGAGTCTQRHSWRGSRRRRAQPRVLELPNPSGPSKCGIKWPVGFRLPLH